MTTGSPVTKERRAVQDTYFISEHPRTIVREIVHLRRTCSHLDGSKSVVALDDFPSGDARICETCLRVEEFNDAMWLWRHWGRPTAAALLLLLVSVVTAWAQPQPPGQPQITFGAPGPTTVPMTITWTPSPPPVSYLIEGSYGDGSGAFSTSQAATTLIHPLPYHSSGAASGGYVCVRSVSGSLQSDGACNGFQSLAKPTTPNPPPGPPTGLTKDIEYDEPTLSDCAGQPAPCSTALSDLARTTVYYSVDGGPTVKALEVPATRPQGGGHIATQFLIAATAGTARVWVTATDTGGNEGPASGSTTVILGAPVTLTVAKVGTGTGAVTGAGSYPVGTVVTPTAAAAAGSTFAGWSGACTGALCSVTMATNTSVTATFTIIPPPQTFTLAATAVGPGTVSIAGSSPYPAGTLVTVTATPSFGAALMAWSGACTGAGACVVTMDANKSVTATFAALPPPQPEAPLVRNRCTVRVSSTPPDATGGWSAQFLSGTSAIGAVDSAAPYERDVILPPGPYSITVRWTKSGVPARTSVARQGTCQ